MKNIVTRIGNLITIKSIVTLILVIVYAILALRGFVPVDVYNNILALIIGFYFGTQHIDDTKKEKKE